jgi:hypothetical protein
MKCLQSGALVVTLFVTSCWLVAQSSAWKPRNELQRSAELARLSLELNFLEVIQVHYSPLSKDEKQQMAQKQAVDAAEGTRLMKKFAANVREAIADKRCSTSCQGQIGPLINDFSEMADTIQRLNQEKIDSSLLPMYRETFELQLKNAREYIQRINLREGILLPRQPPPSNCGNIPPWGIIWCSGTTDAQKKYPKRSAPRHAARSCRTPEFAVAAAPS